MSTSAVNWSEKETQCVYSPLNEGRVSLGSFVVRLPLDGTATPLGLGCCNSSILLWHHLTALSAARNTSAASSTSVTSSPLSSIELLDLRIQLCQHLATINQELQCGLNILERSTSLPDYCCPLVKTPRWAALDLLSWGNFISPPEPSELPDRSAVDITSRSPMFCGSSQATTGKLTNEFELRKLKEVKDRVQTIAT